MVWNHTLDEVLGDDSGVTGVRLKSTQGGGTTELPVKGCFIVFQTGAVSTIASTAGKLYSAGLFTGGDKVLSVGDTLSVSYTATA